MSTGTIRFYTDEVLGKQQSLTPEGFLLCENVPVARTGTLLYAEGEIPVEGDGDHLVRIQREDDEVFAPSAIISFAGKPVTNDHPPTKVEPTNWKQYSVGVVLNPRRGDGRLYDPNYLYADLLIQDAEAIQDVRTGKRQVSAGYDAEYEQLQPGVGRQHNIIGNHVALVDKGRCGPRCAIGDKAMATAATATKSRKPAWKDRIMQAYRTKDESALVDELDKVGDMMGEVLVGDDMMPNDQHHHITVNIGHPGGEAPAQDVADPTPAAASPAGAAAPANGSQAGGAAGGGSVEQMVQQILSRLDAVEQAIAVLANGDDGSASGGEAAPPDDDYGDDPDGGSDPSDGGDDDDKKKKPTGDKRTKDADAGKIDGVVTPPADGNGKASVPPKPGTSDRRASVGDSTSLRGSWQDLLVRAEILAPGYKVGTFDAAKPAAKTHETMCGIRKQVLAKAMRTDESREAITTVAGNERPNFSLMTCDAVGVLFTAASETVKRNNKSRMTPRGATTGDAMTRGTSNMRDSIVDINAKNRKFYNRA